MTNNARPRHAAPSRASKIAGRAAVGVLGAPIAMMAAAGPASAAATDAHVSDDNTGTDLQLSMVGAVLPGLEALGVDGLPSPDLPTDALAGDLEVFDVAGALSTAPNLAGGFLPTAAALGPGADVLPVVGDLTALPVAGALPGGGLAALPGADVLPLVGDLTTLPALGSLSDADLPTAGNLKLSAVQDTLGGLTGTLGGLDLDALQDLDLDDLPVDLRNVELGDLAGALDDLDVDLDDLPSVLQDLDLNDLPAALQNVKLSQLPALADGLQLTTVLSDLDLAELPVDLQDLDLGELRTVLGDLGLEKLDLENLDLGELRTVLGGLDLKQLDVDELQAVLDDLDVDGLTSDVTATLATVLNGGGELRSGLPLDLGGLTDSERGVLSGLLGGSVKADADDDDRKQERSGGLLSGLLGGGSVKADADAEADADDDDDRRGGLLGGLLGGGSERVVSDDDSDDEDDADDDSNRRDGGLLSGLLGGGGSERDEDAGSSKDSDSDDEDADDDSDEDRGSSKSDKSDEDDSRGGGDRFSAKDLVSSLL